MSGAMSACKTPLSHEELVAYWAGDLEPSRNDALEEHLFGCAWCTGLSARVASIAEAIRGLIPPIVTLSLVEALRARGLHIEDNVMTAGVRSHVVFEKQDIILHRLTGLALEDAERVGISLRVEESDVVLVDQDEIPFEAATGEVLIACQRHFAAFPPNVVIDVRTKSRSGDARTARYYVSHEFRTT